jgi:hypothetical protein
MMKLALMRTTTGKEDPELPLLQRISSLELPASEIAAQINASQTSSNRHISTSTVQRRLRESGLHGRPVPPHIDSVLVPPLNSLAIVILLLIFNYLLLLFVFF